MSDRTSAVTIVKQGHANWVVLVSFVLGSWVGALVSLALVIIKAS